MSSISQIPMPWPGPDFTVTFKPSKLKLLLLLVVCGVFVAGGIGGGLEKDDVKLHLCAGFFALGLVVFSVHLHPRASYLTLKKDSFVCCSLFRAHEFRWEDVQEFRVQKIGGNKMVVWDYVPEFSRSVKSRHASKALTGCEAALPEVFGFKAEELAHVMNQMRELSFVKSSPDI